MCSLAGACIEPTLRDPGGFAPTALAFCEPYPFLAGDWGRGGWTSLHLLEGWE
jgi:hypothetical protein